MHGCKGCSEVGRIYNMKSTQKLAVVVECLRPVVYSSLIGCASCIIKSFRSRRSFISSLKFTVRRHKFNDDPSPRAGHTGMEELLLGARADAGARDVEASTPRCVCGAG